MVKVNGRQLKGTFVFLAAKCFVHCVEQILTLNFSVSACVRHYSLPDGIGIGQDYD